MIKINKLSYSFPHTNLFNEISFTIEEGQHCGFIGVSGSGKTTLADIIINPDKYMFNGDMEIDPNWKMAYVNQFSQLDTIKDLTVLEYIGKEYIKLQNDLEIISEEMATSSDIDVLLEKYQEVSDTFDAIGGNTFEMEINKKLNLANLNNIKDLCLYQISGGEFKLIQIIKSMLNKPDLIIMDEPDVFLDFENLNSLKNLINSHKGALIVITHNRYLLNNCFNKILHLENMSLREFDGRYIDYNFSLLEEKIELQELAYEDTLEIERNETLIKKLRFNAGLNFEAAIGKHVNSRAKIIERLRARRIESPFVYINRPNIVLSTDKELDEEVTALKVDDYSISFDDLLLDNINFEIASKDKIVLIGPNGSGKTTLLRQLYENNNNSINFHEDIDLSYLSQLQDETLNSLNTVAEEFFNAGFKSYDDITSCLLSYGFDGEIIDQKISSLSGGEKNLLQLAKIGFSKSNMLLLDEPTSHLDTYSQIALEKAINEYTGAILMVSHDFYSIVNCMDYVLIIEDKTIRRMSMRKFRKMIYANHFDKDYLELEERKKLLEGKIESALEDNNFILAQKLCEDLKPLIEVL